MDSEIKKFLDGSPFAVIGASADRQKYGNKVLRTYQQNGLRVFPVNPHAETIEGLLVFADLASIGQTLHGISIITPPQVTESIIEQAGPLGIKNVWMQPGSESELAVRRAEQFGMNVISGGPCLLIVLGFQETKDLTS